MNVRVAVAWLLIVALTFGGSISPSAVAQSFPKDLEREVIRGDGVYQNPEIYKNKRLLSCRTIVAPQVPGAPVNDSDGVVLSVGGVGQFKSGLKDWIAKHGLESLKGQRVYVTGVSIENKKKIYEEYRSILNAEGVGPEVEVYVLSVRRTLLEDIERRTFRDLMQRVRAFFPVLETQYQSPIQEEVGNEYKTTAFIEAFTIASLVLSPMDRVDVAVVSTVHILTLWVYCKYVHTMRNWFMAPGSSGKENFLKQVLTALPFLINFQFLSKTTAIVDRISSSEVVTTPLFSSPAEIALNVGVTAVLNAVFYSWVINQGVGSWVSGEEGVNALGTLDERRIKAPWVKFIPQVLDAIFFTMAGNHLASILRDDGLFKADWGHVGIAGITLLIGGLFRWKPEVMNIAFQEERSRIAQGFLNRMGATRDKIKKALQIRGPKKDSHSKIRIRPLSLA